MRPRHRADDVERVFDVGDPVAHGFIQRVFEGFAAGLNRHHGGTQELHAVDVGALTFDVFGTHVHHTLQPVAGTNGGCGHAVLACARFGNDARFAHALGEHGLTNHVVDFVRTGVVEVFALEEDLRAAHFAAGARGVVHGRWAAHKVRQFVVEFAQKLGVVLVLGVGFTQLGNRVGEGFTHKAATIGAKVAPGIGLLVVHKK